MRLFVCTLLGADNQQFYARLAAALLRAAAGALRPVPAGSTHITHAFLGDVEATQQADVVEAVAAVGVRHSPIAIRLGPPEVRYARAEPRLVFVDVIGGRSAVEQVTADVVAELARRCPGTIVDRARSPHVTVARFGRRAERDAARAVASAVTESVWARDARADVVSKIQVVSSALTPQGPTYVVVADVPLSGAA